MKPSKFIYLILLVAASQSTSLLAAESLSLSLAEQKAMAQDPLIRALEQQAFAFDEQSIAAGTWPDPRVRFGLMSVPTDTYDLDQEPMTQILVGYQQMLPRGDSLEHKTAQQQAMAEAKRSDVQLRLRKVLLNVRKAWFKVYLQDQSEKIVRQNRRLFKQQIKVSQSLYAAGRSQQQDVLQAELELSLLEDQLQRIASNKEEARANLSKWIGAELAQLPLSKQPEFLKRRLPYQLEELYTMLSRHPDLEKKSAGITANREAVELAKQKYKPQWMLDVSYGKRDGENMDGSDRADFLSVMASIDLPIFTDKRQDRELSAKKKNLQASQYDINDTRRRIESKFKEVHARWLQLNERLRLYQQKVLPQSKQNAQAAMNGYQSGVVSFFTLTRARTAELKAQLQRLRLDVEKAMAYAEIRFLIGEDLK